MTKEKSKKPNLKKQADEADHLKTLKKIKKHKPPKPHPSIPELLNCKAPHSHSHSHSHSDSIQTTKNNKKKKHILDETKSLNPEKPDSDSIQTTVNKKKKKKEKSDEPKSSNPKTSDSYSIQDSNKKKKHKSDKPSKPHSPNPEDFDSKAPDSDSIQTPEKKKKKQKLDKPRKPHSSKAENFDCEIAADSIQTKKKKKQKLDKPRCPSPGLLDSEIDTDSIQAQKRKKKHKLDEPQSPNPEKLDSKIDTDSIRTPKKKKQKLDESQSPKPEKLDSKVGTDTIQTPKKKKKLISDESQNPLLVNPEVADSDIDTDLIQNLLEPHSKDKLIEFLLDSAVKTPSIFSKIIETANQDISHRRIFVHNLNWDTTRESVVSVFQQYGELEACDVVYDRVTGKTKGFGFVIYKSRECANNALKEPKKRIDNRIVSCQLASIGPPVVGCVDNSSRKIYVSNVEKDVDSRKLREFFEKFGEIEVGPLGFDMQTGKSRGYALFVYKSLEGVRKVLEEPNKIFDGKQLNCRMANDWNGRKKNSKSDSSVTTVMMPVPQDLSAVLPRQNMAMVGQYAGLNPMSGQSGFNSIAEGLYANPFAGLLNQLLSQAGIGVNQFGQMGVGFGGYGEAMGGQGMGSLDWNQSVLGSFSGSPSAPMLQGWQHAYSDT